MAGNFPFGGFTTAGSDQRQQHIAAPSLPLENNSSAPKDSPTSPSSSASVVNAAAEQNNAAKPVPSTAAAASSPDCMQSTNSAAALVGAEADAVAAAAAVAASAAGGVCWRPMDIFLRERYRTLCLTPPLSADQKLAQQQLLLQQRVQRFFSEGCLIRACLMGVGGGFIGLLFGSFFFTMKPIDIDHSLPFREQLRLQYRSFLPDVANSAKNFAKLGFIYSLTECFIQKERATNDVNNAIYAGCVTGAILARKGGTWSMAAGCAGFAAFSGIMEKFQRSGGFGSSEETNQDSGSSS